MNNANIMTGRFDDFFELSLGRTPSRGIDSYWGGTHTWVSISDMSSVKYISNSKECITDIAISDTNIPIVKKGTVIMSFKLSIGKVCITEKDLYTNEAIMAFVPKPQYNILPVFLYYYLMSYKWNNSNDVVLGSTLNKKTISQSIISIPSSLDEQKRIVEILDKEFEKIDTLQANAEKGLQQAKDLFQSALKQELQLKEGWNKCVMSDVCELSQGLAINAKTKHLIIEHSSTPLLRIKDLKDNTESIYVDGDKCPKGSMVDVQDIIYTRTGTLGLVFTGRKGVMHNNCFKIKINENIINKTYFIYYISSALFRDKVIRLAERAAQPDITHRIFGSQIFEYPSIEKQINIAKCLNKLNEHCNALQKNYEKTIALCDDMKQVLLRKAFNGEL